MQWLAGAGLICFGLDELARHIGGIVEPAISAFSERFRHLPGSQLITGLPAGVSMQGRRGCLYLRRRRLAGLLTLPQAAGMGIGMALGMMLPAVAVLMLPGALRFPVLIIGLLLHMLPGDGMRQAAGRAMIGLGCCWIGFAICRENVPAALSLPALTLVSAGFAGSLLFRTPVPLWLILVSVPSARSCGIAGSIATAVIAGWAAAVIRMVLSIRTPFRQPGSLLDYRDLRFPERALQAALQEVRRLAEGLAETARGQLPGLMRGSPAGCRLVSDVEQAMNEFKPAAHRFLKALARRTLNERQARLLLHLYRSVSDLERIGDHIDALSGLLAARQPPDSSPAATERQSAMQALVIATTDLVDTVASSITGHGARTEASSRRILEGCDITQAALGTAAEALNRAMETKTLAPSAAILYRELLSHFERIISHIQAIALVEKQPEFWIDPDAVHERGRIDRTAAPPRVSPTPYLERIKTVEADI